MNALECAKAHEVSAIKAMKVRSKRFIIDGSGGFSKVAETVIAAHHCQIQSDVPTKILIAKVINDKFSLKIVCNKLGKLNEYDRQKALS